MYRIIAPLRSSIGRVGNGGGDGAAAAVLVSDDYLKMLPDEIQKRAVKIKASCMATARVSQPDEVSAELPPAGTSKRASTQAYEMAGVGPGDIDVAECHDATAVGELMQYENLGFCPVGEGGRFIASGATQIGGKIAVNTSGGLISRGHPIAASGLAMINEIVTQLRGEAGRRQVENARSGLIENGGHPYNTIWMSQYQNGGDIAVVSPKAVAEMPNHGKGFVPVAELRDREKE